jgi:hypothetical protein
VKKWSSRRTDTGGCGQAGAHAVGAGGRLAPHAAHAQAQRADLGGELGRRDHVHDHTVSVGQHHRGFGVGELLVQRGHLVAGAGDDVGTARAALLELDARDEGRLAGLGRVEPVFVETAAPGLGHRIVGLLCTPLRTSSRIRSHAGGLHAWSRSSRSPGHAKSGSGRIPDCRVGPDTIAPGKPRVL